MQLQNLEGAAAAAPVCSPRLRCLNSAVWGSVSGLNLAQTAQTAPGKLAGNGRVLQDCCIVVVQLIRQLVHLSTQIKTVLWCQCYLYDELIEIQPGTALSVLENLACQLRDDATSFPPSLTWYTSSQPQLKPGARRERSVLVWRLQWTQRCQLAWIRPPPCECD